ncbi:MAG: carbamoyltransferase HypF [Lysobacterales bacterium]|nr:MAG: carbamoyltransferase HypF [Xanthomonadales bacterium]
MTGRVQGVGYRPFVHRLAHELGVSGHVRNLRGDVEVIANATETTLATFVSGLVDRAPPLARPRVRAVEPCERPAADGFAIAPSSATDAPAVSVPPDFYACDDCIAELADPADRRHAYPFINCTQCGPRYTLIEALPYDRPNTAMARFPLCPACRSEYEDPLDRRFHAEPVACPVCGPHLRYVDPRGAVVTGDAAAVSAAVELLRHGRVLAVRGIGGYHLICDARDEAAVQSLRVRKRRPHKPLAVMFPQRGADGLDVAREELVVGAVEEGALRDPARAIVLVPRRADGRLAPGVAPGLAEVGAFLPYSPLHHLLLAEFGGPVVATSGNVSGEPVLTEQDEAEARLAAVADAFLHHDRPILRPADDSVVRVTAGAARPIRLGRGAAPLELELPRALREPVLAVGGHLKLTVALAWDRRVVVSPHVGDMGTRRSEQVFEQVVRDLPRLYDVEVRHWIGDAHPGYTTTRWLQSRGLSHTLVLHHHAHASALVAEHGLDEPAIVFAWDGVGYGGDGTLWGGETFAGSPGGWRRVASLRPFRLPGGDLAGRQPWRSAAALCWEAGLACPVAVPDPIVRAAWERGINSPRSSAAGRVFDAMSALVLGVGETSFEGQGPMWLEARAARGAGFPVLALIEDDSGLPRIDWAPLVEWCSDGTRDVAERAGAVHSALADAIRRVAERERARSGIEVVGLTGGVFQNRLLSELALEALGRGGFRVLLPERIPCNDGGLSYGQVIEFLHRNPASPVE